MPVAHQQSRNGSSEMVVFQKSPLDADPSVSPALQQEPSNGNDDAKLVTSSLSLTLHERAVGEFLNAWSSDWIKALLIGPVFPFIPLLLLADRLVQCLSRIIGCTTFEDSHTQRGRAILDWFCALNLSAVFVRICVLGEVAFTLNVLFAKLTYIFLSWLNGVLASFSLPAILTLVVVVGLIMFLLPPVPGIPVYVFSGIVIATQAKREDIGFGFEGAIVLASFMSVCTKLVACLGQYSIGYFMGRSIKVQQLIGVDRVPTRAIEKIVSQRGLQCSKVFVLIGGPDWPVSVTCGILRVNVPQMMLGTLPVVTILVPCVVAGAALTRITGGEEDPWVAKSRLAILAASAGQGGSLLGALLFIGRTVATDRAELSTPRPEHRQVEELTRREQQYDDAYLQTTTWNTMPCYWKAVIAIAAFLQLSSNFVLSMFDSSCFRPFVLSSDIGDKYTDYPPGLNGDPWSIMLPPAYPALGAFLLGMLLHIYHVKSAESRARALVEQQGSVATEFE